MHLSEVFGSPESTEEDYHGEPLSEVFGSPESTEEDYHGGPFSEVFGSPESTEEDYHGGPLSEVFGSPESTEVDYDGGPLSEVFGSPESTEEEYHDGTLSEVFGSPEWLQTDSVDMPMFSLSEVPSAAPATGGTVFPTASVAGTARAPASDDGTVELTAASATGGTVPSVASVEGAPASSAVAAASVESAAEPAISGTVPSAASVRGEVGGRESSAGAVPSDAAAEAAPSTGGTAAPVESAAWAARKLASAAGSAGDRWVANICGESGAPTHPFDPGTVFPLEVRYSTHGNSSSSNSTSNSTSNHDPWWDTTCVVALLRPFDPGKGCQRDARRGKAVLGVDLPFDRGKHDGRHSMEGDEIRAEGEFFVLFD